MSYWRSNALRLDASDVEYSYMADKVKYIFFNGKYWKVINDKLIIVEGENDKSPLPALPRAGSAAAGEDSG